MNSQPSQLQFLLPKANTALQTCQRRQNVSYIYIYTHHVLVKAHTHFDRNPNKSTERLFTHQMSRRSPLIILSKAMFHFSAQELKRHEQGALSNSDSDGSRTTTAPQKNTHIYIFTRVMSMNEKEKKNAYGSVAKATASYTDTSTWL